MSFDHKGPTPNVGQPRTQNSELGTHNSELLKTAHIQAHKKILIAPVDFRVMERRTSGEGN
jgi:hypothetical protein